METRNRTGAGNGKRGGIVCAYGSVSDDYGKSWDLQHPIQLSISPPIGSAWPTTRQLADGTLITIYAMSPYNIEPPESGRTVCHTVRWELSAAPT